MDDHFDTIATCVGIDISQSRNALHRDHVTSTSDIFAVVQPRGHREFRAHPVFDLTAAKDSKQTFAPQNRSPHHAGDIQHPARKAPLIVVPAKDPH